MMPMPYSSTLSYSCIRTAYSSTISEKEKEFKKHEMHWGNCGTHVPIELSDIVVHQ